MRRLWTLSGQRRLKCVKGQSISCNLVGIDHHRPSHSSCHVIAREITQRIYIVCCLDNHQQTDQYLAGGCLYPIVFVLTVSWLSRVIIPVSITWHWLRQLFTMWGPGFVSGSSANPGKGRKAFQLSGWLKRFIICCTNLQKRVIFTDVSCASPQTKLEQLLTVNRKYNVVYGSVIEYNVAMDSGSCVLQLEPHF